MVCKEEDGEMENKEKSYRIVPVGDQAAEVLFEQRIDERIHEKVMALRDALSGGARAFSGVCAEETRWGQGNQGGSDLTKSVFSGGFGGREAKRLPGQDASRQVALEIQGTIRETVPAYASLLVYYDPLRTDFDGVRRLLERLLSDETGRAGGQGRLIEIPVCYGGIYGEDLPFVAEHAGLTEEEVIRIHSGCEYRIYMLGFLPGFPYLGGLDERLATPRLARPRTEIPVGSVGIGGAQTGIYPIASPGGWRLIGRTPLRLFRPEENGHLPYEAGDRIRFVPIGAEEYERLREREG